MTWDNSNNKTHFEILPVFKLNEKLNHITGIHLHYVMHLYYYVQTFCKHILTLCKIWNNFLFSSSYCNNGSLCLKVKFFFLFKFLRIILFHTISVMYFQYFLTYLIFFMRGIMLRKNCSASFGFPAIMSPSRWPPCCFMKL